MRKPRKPHKIAYTFPSDLTEQIVLKISELPSCVKTDYLREEMMSKYVSSSTDSPELRRSRAIEKWLDTETRNELTNERLLNTSLDFSIIPGLELGEFFSFARDLIVRVIGDTPPIEALIGSFSGGASTSRLRTESHTASKYAGIAHVTPRCKEWFDLLEEELPLWLGDHCLLEIQEVVGNVLFTVPKKADIDRVACKEPDINMFLQKGIGSFFRKGLLRQGINLNDQSINRSLARLGSIHDHLSTLDLSSASDSVSQMLVFQLLPTTWYTLLDAVRSPVTIVDGVEHRNEMFSSMGNGFTFELESLIFWALARTVAWHRRIRGVISVYGDDIICPRGIAHPLTQVLEFCGFQVNPDKSHVRGPFRESCGGHYYRGIDVTPFYIRKPITELADVIHVANSLRKWCQFEPEPLPGEKVIQGILNPEAEDIWLWLKSFVPDALWGGVDTSFKYQLASHDAPSMRLSEQTKRKGTGYGGYLHWHNATWNRDLSHDGIATSSKTINTGHVRWKRALPSAVNRLHFYFLHEIERHPARGG